jgi:Tfp pilus assembly protein PilF
MPDTPAPAYDVFVSYSSKNADWVRGPLLQWLEAQGYTVCIDFRDFVAGAASVVEMERAVLTSRHTLLVLTPEYVASAWTEFEYTLVQTLARGFRDRRLIPLLKAPCERPLRIKALTHVDFTDPLNHAFAYSRLLTALGTPSAPAQREQPDPDAIPFPAPLPQPSRMPLSRNPLFVGRQDDLRELWRVLKTGETAAIGQIAAATGLGGIGKTQLACEFVHRYGQFFAGGVFWLSFADANAVPAEIAACGGSDGMQLRDNFEALPLDEQVKLVMTAWQSATPRLLVFDNCEDEALLDEWRPTHGGCSVVVTSRRASWDLALGVYALRLQVLPRAESLALLRKFRDDLPADDVDLNAIAEELGDLPLALHLAGSFLAKYRHTVTPAAYLQRLSTPTILNDRSLQAAGLSPTKHVQHVARTFEQSYERLDAADPTDALALKLLARAAYFAPGEPLPRDLLISTLNLPDDDADAALQADDALTRLIDLGLLETEAEDWLRLHRLLAAFVRALAADDEAQASVEETVLGIARRSNSAGDPRPLLVVQPHLRAITNAAQQREDKQTGSLCHELGYHLHIVGDYNGAQEYYGRALVIWEWVLGADHPDTTRVLNNLGGVWFDQGDYEQAQRYFEQALAIQERVLGGEHPDTAQSLNNLSSVLHRHGDYERAQRYLERALAIQERVLGVEHPDTAQSLNNLGYLLYAQQDYTGAWEYFERALVIVEQVLGVEHRNTARSLGNLGTVLQSQRDYVRAQGYFERALAIMERLLGADHPDTAVSLNNLGHLLLAQGDYARARVYFERALVINEQRLGPNHPETRTVRSNLADLDVQQDISKQISQLKRRAMVAVVQVLVEGSAEDRTALMARIEETAQQAEAFEVEGLPWVGLAQWLRELAQQLRAVVIGA